jgi:hypothetical protein
MRFQFYVVTAETQSGASAILALTAQEMAESAEAAQACRQLLFPRNKRRVYGILC